MAPTSRSAPAPPAYVALVGDLVASRRSSSRARIQAAVLAVAEELSSRLGDALAAPVTLTAGDEIQALFRKPSRVVEVVQELSDRLYGAALDQRVVFGCGRGAVSTDPPPRTGRVENVAWVDGPCFHHARAALERARKADVWTVFEGFSEELDPLLTSLFDLMGAIRSGWTARQSLYAVTVRHREFQKEVAAELGVNPSVVSESLRAAHFQAVRRAEEAARGALAAFDGEVGGAA